jgi:MATE family multidrug resistance protein
MVKLGFSGFLMVIAEFLAFEVLTLASSYISNTTLAAQAALGSLALVTFQLPFPISVAGSTRLANFIGAGLPAAAMICIKVTFMMAFAAGLVNMILLTSLRNYIPKLFTGDVEVRAAIASVMPIFAGYQLFDAGVAAVNGIMRGMGRQALGGWVNMCCYYLVGTLSLPSNIFLA